MKKILLTALVLSVFSFGCDIQKCPPVDRYFDIEGVRMFYNYKGPESDYSNFCPLADSMKFENFRLDVSFEKRFYSLNSKKPFSLVNSAYALSCVEPGEGGTKEKITEIQLIAQADFNANYKAGTSLNSIVKIDNQPVSDYINNKNKYGIDSYGFQMDLTEKPDPTIKQAFKLVFKLDTGEIYEAETSPVTLY